MEVVVATASTNDLARVGRALASLQNLKAANTYREFYQYWRGQTYARYIKASRETPFAPGSIGKIKPKSKRRIPDSQFGIDSGELLRSLTERVRLGPNGFAIPSGPDYTQFVLDKFRQKGPFAPDSPVGIFPEDIDKLEELIADTIELRIEDALNRQSRP